MAVNHESSEREEERKESQLLNYIKLHMTICVPFCRPILSNCRRSFYYFLYDSRNPRRVIIASGSTRKIAVFATHHELFQIGETYRSLLLAFHRLDRN